MTLQENSPATGLTLKPGKGGARLEMQCPHENGLLYIVPADASWVCGDESRPAHVLAGFFRDLAKLEDPRIRETMNRWGLSYRERPLAQGPAGVTE